MSAEVKPDHPLGGFIPVDVSWAYGEGPWSAEMNVSLNEVTGEIELWIDDPASHRAFLKGWVTEPRRVNVRLTPVQAALLTGQLWLALAEGMDE